MKERKKKRQRDTLWKMILLCAFCFILLFSVRRGLIGFVVLLSLRRRKRGFVVFFQLKTRWNRVCVCTCARTRVCVYVRVFEREREREREGGRKREWERELKAIWKLLPCVFELRQCESCFVLFLSRGSVVVFSLCF